MKLYIILFFLGLVILVGAMVTSIAESIMKADEERE